MGKTFEEMTIVELCDLLCGKPEYDSEQCCRCAHYDYCDNDGEYGLCEHFEWGNDG